MTTWFVSRHAGAKEWAKLQGIQVDKQVSHFDTEFIKQGDVVLGTLPINLVAEVNDRGGDYYHLSLEIPPQDRGKELSANDMQKFGATLECFSASRVDKAL